MASPGVGFWRIPGMYHRRMTLPRDAFHRQRSVWAIRALKAELEHATRITIDLDYELLGPRAEQAIETFQRSAGLVVDGVIGPKTARRLFFPLYAWWEAALEIPQRFLWGQGRLESQLDPGAEGGVDRDDRGVAQWNRRYHPDVTDELAFSNPRFCVQREAEDLRRAFDRFGWWDPALAWHNHHVDAIAWAQNGTAPNERINRYVNAVKQQAKAPI